MTILELIERIDTLITNGAELRDTKAQLATLHERVSALLAEHENLATTHATLNLAHTKLQDEHAKLQQRLAQVDAEDLPAMFVGD